jgi:hypothetical protein
MPSKPYGIKVSENTHGRVVVLSPLNINIQSVTLTKQNPGSLDFLGFRGKWD